MYTVLPQAVHNMGNIEQVCQWEICTTGCKRLYNNAITLCAHAQQRGRVIGMSVGRSVCPKLL